MSKFEQTNQTEFSYEEPIFSGLNVDLPVEPKQVEPLTNKSKKKKLIIIGAVVFFLAIILLIVIIKSKKPQVEIVGEEEFEIITRDLGPFEERIRNARIDLEIADPSNQDLTFPPVDMELRIDKKERR
ncbi:hypothetical protein KKD03_04370 [Patescibacteria group bacterium]|nr:hypothetical protein [Patescibacteria group bacterium]